MPAAASLRAHTLDPANEPIWSRPDPALAAAGIEGEYVVARVRLIAMGLLMLAPTWNLLQDPARPMYVTGFSITLAATIASLGIWRFLRNGRWRPWVGFASSLFDVSMVSFALLSFMLVATPLAAINSTVTFEMYFLAIVATSLRYDSRICLVVGGVTIAQYGGMWAWAAARYDLHDPAWATLSGPYVVVDIVTRLLLLAIATLLSVTIVRRAQRLLYLAARDRLTGLYNRGHFDRALAAAIDTTVRSGQPVALALIDVDHFKQVNDVHGHAAGDRVLQHLAALLSRSMRRTDIVARYGGEEFVILMPDTSRESALLRMEALRVEIAESPAELAEGLTQRVAFSAGVAAFPADADATDGKSLVAVADRRLLAAKRAGRGRCLGADHFEWVEPALNRSASA